MPIAVQPIDTPTPGWYIVEQDVEPTPSGGVVGPVQAAVIGVCQAGPLNKLVPVGNLITFESIFGRKVEGVTLAGGFDNETYPLYDWVRKFFAVAEAAGIAAVVNVIRIVHYASGSTAAAKATLTLDDEDTGDSWKLNAAYEGEYGNQFYATVEDDPIINTTLAATISAGATSLQLTNPGSIEIGQDLKITNGVNTEYVRVLAIDGATISFTTVKDAFTGLVNGYSATVTTLKSAEVKLSLYKLNALLQTWRQLGNNPALSNYGPSVIAQYVKVSDVSDGAIWQSKPKATVSPTALTGGNDGLTGLANSDYIGDRSLKTGMYVLEDATGAWDFAIPGKYDTTVLNAAFSYAKERITFHFYADCQPGVPQSTVKNDRITNAWDTFWGFLYFPWVGLKDSTTGKEQFIPPSADAIATAHVLDRQLGPHRSGAGTKVDVGVLLTRLQYLVNNRLQGELNPLGINVIRYVDGVGYRVWGARTLSSRKKYRWISHRRWLSYAEAKIVELNQSAVFDFNDIYLYQSLTNTTEKFLQAESSKRALEPDATGESFLVKCDEQINTPQTKQEGQVYMKVRVNQTNPAEAFVLLMGFTNTGTLASLQEL